MINIPTEQDFLATEVHDEALQNNRVNGLPAKAPTEMRRKQADGSVAVWTNTSPAAAKAWVDDMVIEIRRMDYAEQINSWEQEYDRPLTLLSKYFPEEHERVCEELWLARENASTKRW